MAGSPLVQRINSNRKRTGFVVGFVIAVLAAIVAYNYVNRAPSEQVVQAASATKPATTPSNQTSTAPRSAPPVQAPVTDRSLLERIIQQGEHILSRTNKIDRKIDNNQKETKDSLKKLEDCACNKPAAGKKAPPAQNRPARPAVQPVVPQTQAPETAVTSSTSHELKHELEMEEEVQRTYKAPYDRLPSPDTLEQGFARRAAPPEVVRQTTVTTTTEVKEESDCHKKHKKFGLGHC